MNLVLYGACFSMLPINYKPRKLLWELIGGTFLLWKLAMLYKTHPYLLDLKSNFMTCIDKDTPNLLIIQNTAWYVYSHSYNYLSLESNYDNLMMWHHVVTIGLLALCHHFHYLLEGLAILFIMSLSNPFLQISNLFNHYNIGLKKYTFVAFAMMFCAMRIILYPHWILRHTIYYAHEHISCFQDWTLYYIVNSILVALYALQWWWYNKILGILISTVM